MAANADHLVAGKKIQKLIHCIENLNMDELREHDNLKGIDWHCNNCHDFFTGINLNKIKLCVTNRKEFLSKIKEIKKNIVDIPSNERLLKDLTFLQEKIAPIVIEANDPFTGNKKKDKGLYEEFINHKMHKLFDELMKAIKITIKDDLDFDIKVEGLINFYINKTPRLYQVASDFLYPKDGSNNKALYAFLFSQIEPDDLVEHMEKALILNYLKMCLNYMVNYVLLPKLRQTKSLSLIEKRVFGYAALTMRDVITSLNFKYTPELREKTLNDINEYKKYLEQKEAPIPENVAEKKEKKSLFANFFKSAPVVDSTSKSKLPNTMHSAPVPESSKKEPQEISISASSSFNPQMPPPGLSALDVPAKSTLGLLSPNLGSTLEAPALQSSSSSSRDGSLLSSVGIFSSASGPSNYIMPMHHNDTSSSSTVDEEAYINSKYGPKSDSSSTDDEADYLDLRPK